MDELLDRSDEKVVLGRWKEWQSPTNDRFLDSSEHTLMVLERHA